MDTINSATRNRFSGNINSSAWKMFQDLKKAFKEDLLDQQIAEVDNFKELAEKKYFERIKAHLDDHFYGLHTKVVHQDLSEQEIIFLRFTETLMFLMWSPVGNLPSHKDISEELKMHRMSNIAKPSRIRQFLTELFPISVMKRWAKNKQIMTDPSMSSDMICAKCMSACGVPVVPDQEDESLLDYRLRQKLKSLLHDIDQINEFDPYIPKDDINHMRTQLEFFFQEYAYFLSAIPDISKNLRSVYDQNVKTFFSPRHRPRNQPYTDFINDMQKQSLGIISILIESTSNAMDDRKLNKYKNRIYPKIKWSVSKDIRDILNLGSHAGKMPEYSISEFKKNFSEYVNNLLILPMIPKGAVFFRKEQDAFGIHYKGNFLDGEPAVVLDHSLKKESQGIEIGRLYYIYSDTYPAYLDGFVAPILVRK